MLSIQTNVNSMNAQENLRVTNQFQGRTISRLTSGYRINESGDDAAGLAVANKYRSDVTELQQGVRNANDGLSTLQIIDGGLSNISKMLDRLKTLATQSASVTFTGNRATLNQEYSSLLNEINRQAENIGLGHDAAAGRANNKSIDVYVGGGKSMSNSKVTVNLSGAEGRVSTGTLGVNGTKIEGTLTKRTGSASYTPGTITFTFGNGSSIAAVSATSAHTAADVANMINANAEAANEKVFAVMNSAGTNFDIYSESASITITTSGAGGSGYHGSTGAITAAPAITVEATAEASIAAISGAVERLGKVQGKVGTGQNQLGYAIQLAQSQITSFSAAESRIRDADVASEAANLTKAQVLQQASLAALAQANSAPQAVLSLLRG